MARINQELLERLQRELRASKRKVYRLIEKKARETLLDPELAAVLVAADCGVNIAKYATPEQRAAIRGALPRLPGHPPPLTPIIKKVLRPIDPVSLDLSTVANGELQEILSRDLAELNTARSQGTDKTAKTCIVLCGSITEALLLERLSRDEATAIQVASNLPPGLRPKSPTRLDEWHLNEMVTVDSHWTPPLLPEDAGTGAHQLRKWRNLVHPGRELREAKAKRIRPTRERAENAIAFIQFIGRELGP